MTTKLHHLNGIVTIFYQMNWFLPKNSLSASPKCVKSHTKTVFVQKSILEPASSSMIDPLMLLFCMHDVTKCEYSVEQPNLLGAIIQLREIACLVSIGMKSLIGDLIQPGEIVSTRMPASRSSSASGWVIAINGKIGYMNSSHISTVDVSERFSYR